MAQVVLDIPLIRGSQIKDFIPYLNTLLEDHSELSICHSLLTAFERGDIDLTILTVFIPWCKSIEVIVLYLNYPTSIYIRNLGTKHFGKALLHPAKWAAIWKGIGGTQGLVDYLARVSVTEVKFFARIVAGCRRGRRIPAREKRIEELLQALLPSHYPDSAIQTRDRRPIQAYYASLVGACSDKFVAALLDAEDMSNPLYKNLRTNLPKSHAALLEKRVLDVVTKKGKEDRHTIYYLDAFCSTVPPAPGPIPRVSATMAFSMRVLKLRLGGNNRTFWPGGESEFDVFEALLQRCIRRRLPQDKLRDVLTLGLGLLEAINKWRPESAPNILWVEISTRWGRSPVEYEDLLTHALRLGLGGAAIAACDKAMTLSKKLKLKPDRLWDLLRLYCLHAPKKDDNAVVDLDTTSDLAPLGKQKWPSELFYTLEKEKAIRLLERLEKSFPNYEFLTGPTGPSGIRETSILSEYNTVAYSNVVFLLTILRRESPEVQAKVKATVEEYRKKAAASREQTARGSFACTAVRHSIASGNLDLYGETITWLQRFVRDPLTLKQVIHPDTVNTIEGTDLLSGIPDPLPQNVTLEGVASMVDQANAILITFHETMLIAKREPSYQEHDWRSVSELFGAAIEKRATRARAVQKHLVGSRADLYAAIWEKTLAMLEIVDVKFVRIAINPIRDVINTLPPTTLAGVAKSMLATGAERRKKKDRQPGDDALESLSYSVLLRLIKGERPELAQRLVLETILDRPDASSWHRQFLSEPFMRSLTAKQAQEMLLAFATAIGEKLEEQSYVRVGEEKAAPSAPPQSFVKVTTVKYLAQLLDNAPFISADAAIDVLVELFKAGTHRDIRLATLGSLLSLLNTLCSVSDENWRANPAIDKVLGAIETVIPVVGSINEGRPLREADWIEAQATGKLPDVSDRNPLPPLMGAIVYAPHAGGYPGLKKMREEFVSRFILPIYKLAQEEQHRWTTLFLAKHWPSLKASDLPPAPIAPQLWITLIQSYKDLLPRSILDDYNKHILMTISQPGSLKALNRHLRADRELCQTPEMVQWLSVFGVNMTSYERQGHSLVQSGTKVLVDLIHHNGINSSVPNSITTGQVQQMILAQASFFLSSYDTNPKFWSNFTKALRQPCRTDGFYCNPLDQLREVVDEWQTTCRPILQKAVELLQARKVLYRKEGNLKVLPSVDLLNHWLLPYPVYPKLQADIEKACALLAAGLERNISQALEGEGNVLRWPRISEDAFTISELLNTSEERLRVAVHVGKLVPGRDQKSLGLNFVKMGLATRLIEKGGLVGEGEWKVPEELLLALRGVLRAWSVHEEEGVRERAVDWKDSNAKLWWRIEKGEKLS